MEATANLYRDSKEIGTAIKQVMSSQGLSIDDFVIQKQGDMRFERKSDAIEYVQGVLNGELFPDNDWTSSNTGMGNIILLNELFYQLNVPRSSLIIQSLSAMNSTFDYMPEQHTPDYKAWLIRLDKHAIEFMKKKMH